jgi:hypothetical protein
MTQLEYKYKVKWDRPLINELCWASGKTPNGIKLNILQLSRALDITLPEWSPDDNRDYVYQRRAREKRKSTQPKVSVRQQQ